MECSGVSYTGHVLTRMFERGISHDEVKTALGTGEVIEAYPDDHPYPSCLLWGCVEERVLHVVVAQVPATSRCIVVTVYEPDPVRWDDNGKRRRS